MANVHELAIVEAGATLAADVEVGPWSYIGSGVEIDAGTVIGPHVVIKGPTKIGRDNRLFQFSSIGEDPQDKKYAGEQTFLEIGHRNVIREYCTISRGTAQDERVTRIGDDNLLMAYVHVAHDCQLGSHLILANNATLAGHIHVADWAILGGYVAVHQFCHIGAHAFIAATSCVTKDVPPYLMVENDKARGLNFEGLKRRGFSADVLKQLKQLYKTVYMRGLRLEEALAELDGMVASNDEAKQFVEFVQRSARGIVR